MLQARDGNGWQVSSTSVGAWWSWAATKRWWRRSGPTRAKALGDEKLCLLACSSCHCCCCCAVPFFFPFQMLQTWAKPPPLLLHTNTTSLVDMAPARTPLSLSFSFALSPSISYAMLRRAHKHLKRAKSDSRHNKGILFDGFLN